MANTKTFSEIDWLVMWKLFHNKFCGIYLIVGVLIRLVFAKRVKPASLGSRSLYAISSSTVLSLLSTWFPILPILACVLLNFIAGHSANEYVLISTPIIAVSLGIETALVDAMFLRLLLKRSLKGWFWALLVINVVNATSALVLGLAWAFHHMPTFIAALDS